MGVFFRHNIPTKHIFKNEKKDVQIMDNKKYGDLFMNASEKILKNPIDDGWYADPEARIYEGMYVIYATRSLPFDEQKNQVYSICRFCYNLCWSGYHQLSV